MGGTISKRASVMIFVTIIGFVSFFANAVKAEQKLAIFDRCNIEATMINDNVLYCAAPKANAVQSAGEFKVASSACAARCGIAQLRCSRRCGSVNSCITSCVIEERLCKIACNN